MNVENNQKFPLTSIQWAYYIGRNKSYESGGIATHVYYELKNDIDVTSFEIALNKVISRHGMLRAVVEDTGEQRIIENPGYYKIQTKDLRHLDKHSQSEYVLKRRGELSHHVYDPKVWPLFTIETVLFNKEKAENYMFISLDMLIADASSLTLMFKEILEYYVDPQLEKPLPNVQFRDYITYLEETKASKRYGQDKDYWLKKINDIPLAPNLPSYGKEGNESNKFRRMRYEFNQLDWVNIKNLLAPLRILPTVFLCTCYAEVLSHWSGESSFSLNLTLSNRGKIRGCNEVIGDFTSLMLIPLTMEDTDQTFFEKVKRVQDSFVEAYSHASYDGVLFEREIAKYKGIQNQAVFPIVFTSLAEVSENNQSASLLGELQFSISQTPQVYLDCQVHEEGDNLVVTWDYLEQKYDDKMMEEMFEQFTRLIQRMGSKNRAEYKSIFQLNDISMERIKKYNETYKPFPADTLQSIIQKSFQEYKNKIAIIDGKKQYSYADLEEQSQIYADYLIEKGIGVGDFVGIEGTRNADTIIKIMGVIRVGAAYVPINPDYPSKRVQYILNHCGCKEYLTKMTKPQVKQNTKGSVNATKAEPKDIAYVIYTSGSTGKPKGVIINNEAVCNTLYDINERFFIGEEEKILNVSSYGFDLSVYDIFGSILAGACMVIGKEPRDIQEIKDTLLKEKITVWNSVPAILELVMDCMGEEEKSDDLKIIMLSGDWIPISLFERVKTKFPNAKRISLGGATEGAIWSIYYDVNKIKENWNSIPYGYPLSNQTCYVFNKEQRLCPDEVVGEIYIGGKGVANGYINNLEQTEKSFINHEEYGRLYRTGDLGVFRREGYIDILGRIDQQIKMNGYRIETGEIEKVIEENKYVKKTFVEVQKIGNSQQIVAYIVPQKEKAMDINPPDKVLDAGTMASREVPKEMGGELANKIEKDMNDLSLECIKSTIKELIEWYQVPEKFLVTEFLILCQIKKTYSKLMQRWLEILERENCITKEGEKYNTSQLTAYSKTEIKNRLDVIRKKYADVSFLHNKNDQKSLTFFEQCMMGTREILVGEQPVINLLFPEGSWDIAENLYKESPSSRYFNKIITEIIDSYASVSSLEEKTKILEVGAGTGGATYQLLKRLKTKNVEYTYTDISKFFTNQAKEMFKEYNFVKYDIYNLDCSPQSQGYEMETYDIILASNVMHDVEDLTKSLKDIHDMLKPGGIFVLLEMTRETYLYMTTFELLEGYSSYQDFRLENNSALLDQESWVLWLQKSGFSQTAYFPSKESGIEQTGENVIIGFKENISRFLNEEIEDLKKDAKLKLAAYMLPKTYIQISEFSLNHNGKVDKTKLPKVQEALNKNTDFITPQNKLEEGIYKIWCELLEQKEFGIDEDFFNIGGDSLIMIKFLSRMEKTYQYKISIKEFMEHPKIRNIAKSLNDSLATTEG